MRKREAVAKAKKLNKEGCPLALPVRRTKRWEVLVFPEPSRVEPSGVKIWEFK